MQNRKSDRDLIEELLAEVKALREENRILRRENRTLIRRVADLEERLNTNSRNSSKSPSQDPYRKRTGKKAPSEKNQGAQEGHEGYTRSTVPPEEVTEFREIHPLECPHCGGVEFIPDPICTEERQVTELPEIQPHVIQFNIHTERCVHCQNAVKADTPKEAESAFGPRLKGFISLLSGDLGLTKRKVVSLADYLNIKVSVGSVCNIHHLAGKILEGPYEEIRQHTLGQAALHADETSWYRRGKRQWLWIVTGAESGFFKIDPSRSAEAFQKIVEGGSQEAPLTTDRYAAYNSYNGPRQNCWSHLDRDFEKVADRDDVDGLIGKRLKEEADEVFLSWRHFQDGLLTRKELQAYVEVFVIPPVEVLILLGSVGQGCKPKTQGTCKRLLSSFNCLWTYLYHEGVEPTNNLAERDLRPSVIQRKLSYGTQSDAGEAFVERILSVAITFRKQARNIFGYLTDCFRAHSRDGPIPTPL
jgi:transposase